MSKLSDWDVTHRKGKDVITVWMRPAEIDEFTRLLARKRTKIAKEQGVEAANASIYRTQSTFIADMIRKYLAYHRERL